MKGPRRSVVLALWHAEEDELLKHVRLRAFCKPCGKGRSCRLSAYHAADVQYLFGIPSIVPAPPLDAPQEKLADAMVAYWTAFARTGQPKATGEPSWPSFRSSGQQMLSLETPRRIVRSDFAPQPPLRLLGRAGFLSRAGVAALPFRPLVSDQQATAAEPSRDWDDGCCWLLVRKGDRASPHEVLASRNRLPELGVDDSLILPHRSSRIAAHISS